MSDCCKQGTSLVNVSSPELSFQVELQFENDMLMLAPVLVNSLIGVSTTILILIMSISLVAFIGAFKSEDFSWKPRFLILQNQLLCDMLFVAVTIPPALYNLINQQVVQYGAKCYILIFTMTTAVICSFMNLAFMAFERYYYICHAIHYIPRFTVRRTKAVLCGMWLLALTMAALYIGLLTRGHSTSDELGGFFCEADRLERNLGFPKAAMLCRKFLMIFWFFSCLFVFMYSYFQMYKLAKVSVQPFQHSNHRAQRTVVFYSVMYALQALPLAFKITLDVLLSSGWVDRQTFALVDMLNQTVVMMISPCLHPVIYGLRNSELRVGLQVLFRFLQCRKRRQVVQDSRMYQDTKSTDEYQIGQAKNFMESVRPMLQTLPPTDHGNV